MKNYHVFMRRTRNGALVEMVLSTTKTADIPRAEILKAYNPSELFILCEQ